MIFTGLLWIFWSVTKTPVPWLVPVFSIVLAVNGILFFKGVPTGLKLWGFILISADFFYLTAELFCIIAVNQTWIKPQYYWPEAELGVPVFPYFDRDCARYDSLRGFRWTGKGRAVKIANGNLVFDKTFVPNNKGFISKSNYEFRKKDSNIFRWMILGDSFTDGYFLDTPWPDKANEILGDSNRTELYSFGINGGGIANWRAVFFNEIIPYYEFDGIILASFGNDYSRDFFILHHENPMIYFGWNGGIKDKDIRNIAEIKPHLDSLELMKNSDFLDDRIATTRGEGPKTPDLFLMNAIVNFVRVRSALTRFQKEARKIYNKELTFANRDENLPYNMDAFSRDFGPEHARDLRDIISYADSNHKKIIFALVPELIGLRMVQRKNPPVFQLKMRGLASDLHAGFFDGYKELAKENPDSLWKYFLNFDGHWSQKGSDVFARQIAEFLLTRKDSIDTMP